MSAGMGTVDGGKVDPGTPQPTHIHVHIHQESALATLLIRGCSLLRSPAPGATSQTWGRSRLLVASWVVQIVLGVLSGVLGGFLQIFYGCTLCGSGAALWTGAVAVLAGAVAFIYEKRGGIYWALLRTLLALAAFSTAIAAIVIGARNFYEHHFYFRDYICHVSSTAWSQATTPPSTLSPEEARRMHLCLSYLSMLKALIISFPAMLLGVWVLLLLVSLAPLCLSCWRRSRCKKIKRPRRAKTISLSCETQIRSWTRQAFGPESSPAGRSKPETTGRMKQALCPGQVLSLKSEDQSTNLSTATY
uniref:transmembrane protein 176A isoform X2 n=1 Tax=Halichoerus grypus TaxID=9711 RepID=UPI001659DA20|nr:transmembrane protein 176A isoform X2 [Halichoerus grypus]